MINGIQDISLTGVAQDAGMDLKKSGSRFVALCPLHPEETPSFFIFDDSRYKCFSCGESGDQIDFIQKVYHLSFKDALRHLKLDQPVTPETQKQVADRKRRAGLVKRFRVWEVRKADQVSTYIRVIHQVTATWQTPDDLENNGDILEILPHLEHELEVLCSGSDRRKFELLTKGKGRWASGDLGLALDDFMNNQNTRCDYGKTKRSK